MVITRLHENTPAGILRVEIEQDGATVVVRDGILPNPLEVRTAETASDEETAAERARNLVEERTARGAAVASEPEPHAARYLRERFEDQLVADYGVERREPSSAVLDELESLYGRAMPPELAIHLQMRGSVALGWCNFGEWRIWTDDPVPLDLDLNTFAHLLTYDPHALKVFLADLVPIGTFGNGDVYYAALDPLRPDEAVVYRFDDPRPGQRSRPASRAPCPP